MEAALRFLRQHEASRGDWLTTAIVEQEGTPEEELIELQKLALEGRKFGAQAVAALSPTSDTISIALDITNST